MNASAPSDQTSAILELAESAGTSDEQRNSLGVITMAMCWMFAVVALSFPLFPIYFRGIGLHNNQIALLLAAGGVTALLAEQLWGYLADVVLNRKAVLLIMSGFSVATSLALPLFPNFRWLLVMMIVFTGLSNARVSMLNASMLAQPEGERLFGKLRSIGSVFFAAIAVAASLWADRLGPGGEKITFPCLAGVNLALFLTVATLKDRPFGFRRARTHQKSGPSFAEVQRFLLRKPVVRWFLLFVLITQLAHGLSLQFQSLLVKDIGGTTTHAVVPLCIGALAETITLLYGKRLMKHIRLMPLFLVTVVAQVIRWALIYWHPTLAMIWVLSVLHMFTFGLMYYCCIMMVNREAPPEYRSSGQTMLALVYGGVGSAVGPLLGAFFFSHFNLVDWYAVASFLALTGMIPWYFMKQHYEAEHHVSGWLRK